MEKRESGNTLKYRLGSDPHNFYLDFTGQSKSHTQTSWSEVGITIFLQGWTQEDMYFIINISSVFFLYFHHIVTVFLTYSVSLKFTILKCKNIVGFGIFTKLCIHYYYPISEHFNHPPEESIH